MIAIPIAQDRVMRRVGGSHDREHHQQQDRGDRIPGLTSRHDRPKDRERNQHNPKRPAATLAQDRQQHVQEHRQQDHDHKHERDPRRRQPKTAEHRLQRHARVRVHNDPRNLDPDPFRKRYGGRAAMRTPTPPRVSEAPRA
jgi:hypothetical protein